MATILGTNNADQLGADSRMTTGADRISAAGGNDTLVYDLATAGGADTYYGGTGVDTLQLNLTAAEWTAHRAKVLALQTQVANAAKSTSGAVAAGTNFGKLDFGAGKTLQVYEVESVEIYVDGVKYTGEVTPTNQAVTITQADVAGEVVEDDIISANGSISFTDADLADVHSVSFVQTAGQAVLGTFSLDAVSESATTAEGSVGWTFELDNNAAAVNALNAGQSLVQTYTVSVTDNKGSTATKQITVTIRGTTDAPVIETTDTGAVVEAGAGTAGTPVAAGKMPLDGVTAAATWETYVAEEIGTDGYNNGYDWGDFTITANGQWKFVLDQAKADVLLDGEEMVLTFAVLATEDGASVRRDVTITLTGADDASRITVEAGADLTVVEAGGIDNEINDDGGASGKLTVVDPDDDTVVFEAKTYSTEDGLKYGDLNIDADGNWGYSLRNGDANVQALKPGQTVTEKVTVKATDGTSHTLSITITGAEDVATMAIVDTLVTSVDDDGFLLDANGAQVLDADGNPKQVTVAESRYDNLVHEAPGKNYAGQVDSTTSGKLSLTDPDGGDLTFHALDAAEREDGLFVGSVAQGTYGSFALNAATGEWTYTLNNNDADTQALKGTEVLEDTFDSVVIYSADGLSSQTITVHIKGADDGYSQIIADTSDPTYNSVVFEEIADENGDLVLDGEAKGKLEAIDPDGDDSGADPFTAQTLKGKYGSLEIDATGAWTYTAATDDEYKLDADGNPTSTILVKDIDRLAKGQVVTESFVIKTVGDAASYAINVRLTGANDAAVLEHLDSAGAVIAEPNPSVTEAGGVNNTELGIKTASGVVKFNDLDDGESGFAAGTPATKAGLYGTFKLNAATGAWSYDLDNSKVNHLKANEEVVDTLVLTSKDGTKAELNVTVIGADDASLIEAVLGGDYTAKEAGGLNNAVKGDTSASGTLKITDPDGSAEDTEQSFAAVFSTAGGEGGFDSKNVALAVSEAALSFGEPAAATDGKVWGQYGYFTFNGETNKWTYTLVEAELSGIPDSAAVAERTQALAAGEKALDVLRVYASNMSASFDIKVNITGANDSAVITNDLAAADSFVQAGGFEKAVDGVAAEVSAATELSGTVTVVDPDGGAGGAALGFKPIAATSLVGVYGNFTFDNTSGAWTYTLNENDKDTRALLINESATDKLNITATDGTVYTVNVKVKGANNAPEVLQNADGNDLVAVNSNGTITYTVADGDKGGKLTLQVVEGDVVRDVTALTVVDGGVSTVKAATANSTVLYTGMMQVTDKTTGHAAAELNTYLGMGTKNGDVIDSSDEDPSVGSLISSMDGNDTVTTGAGTDYVNAGAGNDTVTTGAGNDTILGGLGNDTIDAGDGDDRIEAGAGVDVLTGGAGADTFVFLTSSTDFVKATAVADSISDFTSGEDKLLLSKSLLPTTFYALTDVELADGTAGKDGIFETIKLSKALNGALKGAETTEWFRDDLTVTNGIVSTGMTSDDRLVFDASTGTLWYDADGNRTTAAVKVVDLGVGATLAADDIQFG